MSATDELRRMLDERGIEHFDCTHTTFWLKDESGFRASADEGTNGLIHLWLWCATPEQAIDATLEIGTCELEPTFSVPVMLDRCNEYYCTKCGEYTITQSGYTIEERDIPKYCAFCGSGTTGTRRSK